jgi:hypothetical protein
VKAPPQIGNLLRQSAGNSPAPAALLFDADAVASLEATLRRSPGSAVSDLRLSRFRGAARIRGTPCVALPFTGGLFSVHRTRTRLYILQDSPELSDADWRPLREAELERFAKLDVPSGILVIAVLNESLEGIEKSIERFRASGEPSATHREDWEAAGALVRVDPGRYALKRGHAYLDEDDEEGLGLFELVKLKPRAGARALTTRS